MNPAVRKDYDWSRLYPGSKKKVDHNAYRLAQTMSTHAHQQAVIISCREDPLVDGVEWRSSGSSRVCPLCEQRNGEVFPLDKCPMGQCILIPHIKKAGDDPHRDAADAASDSFEREFRERQRQTEEAKKQLTSEKNRGIIKNIELPSEVNTIKSMDRETRKLIQHAINNVSEEYIVRSFEVAVLDLGASQSKTPFQFQPYEIEKALHFRIVINSGYYFNDSLKEFSERIMRNYNNKVLAAKNVEDLIAHEMAHLLTFQDCNSMADYIRVNNQLSKEYVIGVSGYSDAKLDGAETIAEAFVRIRNNEQIPQEAIDLVKRYIERWRK